ncbi:MAG: NAD(P)H-dependent oxidoreductase [Methanospirillum sp.]
MNVLYVYAHPDDPRSLNAALRAEAERMLASMGHTVNDSDLYRMDFRPVLDERDFPDRAVAERFIVNVEIRRSLSNAKVPADVAVELEKLRDADLVIFQFPLWWSSVPAILKGWFDRVLSFGFAADTGGAARQPFLRGKKALIVTTLEAPEENHPTESQSGIRELLVPISVNTLSYAGMTVLPTFIVYDATPEKPPEWVASQVERLKAHLVLVLTGL